MKWTALRSWTATRRASRWCWTCSWGTHPAPSSPTDSGPTWSTWRPTPPCSSAPTTKWRPASATSRGTFLPGLPLLPPPACQAGRRLRSARKVTPSARSRRPRTCWVKAPRTGWRQWLRRPPTEWHGARPGPRRWTC
uniref:Putative secreted protein n=1 Tax=Ixodes ricinus TaxID=34613 RepID=A0A147BRH9_IXORI